MKARKTLEILTNTDSVTYADRDGFPERTFRVIMRYFFPGWSGNMRSIAAIVTIILMAQVTLFAEDKTTPAATYTLEKRLRVPITLDVKDQSLKAVLEAVAEQLEGKKQGRLGYIVAISAISDARIHYTCTDKPVAEVLEEILKPLALGYVVISKADDKTDGYLSIRKGTERGYEPGKEPKVSTASAEDEKAAGDKLTLAKRLIDDKKRPDAKIQLKFLMKKYPDTKAAAEAKELLETFDK